jgi:RNA-directed DNA polymerase
MKNQLESCISNECQKHIDRHYNYLFELEKNNRRKARRLGINIDKQILKPDRWDIDDGFDPFKVNSKKQLKTYAYTLNEKLRTLTYKPKTSVIESIPKASGGSRELNIFQIPDAAISRLVYKSLLLKNINLFSNYAYAYREDRNAHDAIFKISADWKNNDRVYVAEFDFSKFFDKITHGYLWDILYTRGFLYTEMEEYILHTFLESNYSQPSSYNLDLGTPRKAGIPQGTSISLFLANLVCWELDHELEGIGVRFARYADDTLIWSNSYDKVVRAYDIISKFSILIGSPINFAKSEGITLISEKVNEEIKSKTQVHFLGYNISLKKISISNKNVASIKEKISFIVYENLIQSQKKGIFNSARLDLIDLDYVIALSQIRSYLYGGLNDTKLRHYKLGIIDRLNFRGLMSYYPLVNDEEQLKILDGWLIHTLKQSLRWREKSWYLNKGRSLPGPTQNWIEEIVNNKKWVHPGNNIEFDLRVPSFLQINRAMKVGLNRGGIRNVANPRSQYY